MFDRGICELGDRDYKGKLRLFFPFFSPKQSTKANHRKTKNAKILKKSTV